MLFADARQAISVEVDSTRSVVRSVSYDVDFLVQTNHFLNPLMKRREMEFPLEREYTIGRYRLLSDAVKENYGRLDRRRLVDIISCNLDRGSMTTRMLGDFPPQYFTLTGVLFEPETSNRWVASGEPPAVCYHEYRGFNVAREIAGEGRDVRLPALARSSTPVLANSRFRPVDESARRSLQRTADPPPVTPPCASRPARSSEAPLAHRSRRDTVLCRLTPALLGRGSAFLAYGPGRGHSSCYRRPCGACYNRAPLGPRGSDQCA